MYTVTYSYYNYARQTKSFGTYAEARGFYNRITRSPGVRYSEIIVQGEAA